MSISPDLQTLPPHFPGVSTCPHRQTQLWRASPKIPSEYLGGRASLTHLGGVLLKAKGLEEKGICGESFLKKLGIK